MNNQLPPGSRIAADRPSGPWDGNAPLVGDRRGSQTIFAIPTYDSGRRVILLDDDGREESVTLLEYVRRNWTEVKL